MVKFGLIGYPLSHSFSKRYFTEKFERMQRMDHSYELFPLENVTQLRALLETNSSLCGLNVTIPHKLAVMPLLDELDAAANVVGAVNCIKVDRGNEYIKLKGYNTDVIGFEQSLRPLLKAQHTHALVFGNGGSAKAVFYVLEKLGIQYTTITRDKYSSIDQQMLDDHKLLINTTPLGMYPDVTSCPPFNYEQISAAHLAYDLVYNPELTTFLKRASAQGAAIKNGLEMLELQAEAAWEIWEQDI